MVEVQHDLQDTVSAIKNNPVVTAYLCIVFATPFSSGSSWHVLYALSWFLLFITYVFFHTRKYQLSLIRQLKKYHAPAFYLLVAFAASSCISYVLIMFDDVGLTHKIYATIRYLVYWIVTAYVFALARFALVNNLSQGRIFICYMAGTMVLAALLLLIYFFGGAPNAERWSVNPPVGEHVRLMGMITSVALLVSVIIFSLKKNNGAIFQVILLFCMLISAAFMVWTGSRASMVLALLTIMIIVGMGKYYSVIGINKIVCITICLALSVLVADKLSIFEWNGIGRAVQVSTVDKIEVIGEPEATVEFNDKFTSGRLTMWRVTLNAVTNAPWFGLGPYGYYFIEGRPNVFDHPHNFVLQFLVEWGITGCSFMLALLVYLAWHGLKNIPSAFRSRDIDYVIPASVVFILTLTGLFDGTYFLSQPLFCLATAFAAFPFFGSTQRDYFNQHIHAMPGASA